MPYDRNDRLRRAAILVASLDEPLAQQVLDGLPPSVRLRVLDEAEQLEEIDAEEQEDVLAEFRRLSRGRRTASDGAVEADFSGGHSTDADDEVQFSAAVENHAAAAPVDDVNDGEARAMAELLAAEHPQIVAAALARLSEAQSAAVFAALPADLQSDVLARLSDLAPADEAAVEEISTQINLQLEQRRQRQARAAAGAELVQKILARTPAPQRTVLLARIAARDPLPAVQPGKAEPRPLPPALRVAAVDPVAQQALNLAAAMRRSQGLTTYGDPPLEDRSAEFDTLSDDALVVALRSADETTVLRALAASGEGLLARVIGMLPRRQGKQLKRMLANLGPTRLADLHQAQHRLLDLAHRAADADVHATAAAA
jgi:flagellar motor switch protein FliG